MKEYKFVNGFFREEIEIKRSKFIASVCGGLDEDGCIEFISKIKKEFPDATHNCYAYVADEVGNVARFSDDSEPSGTAGQPMLDTGSRGYEIFRRNKARSGGTCRGIYAGGD